MRSVKLAIGIVFALVPVVYCGALFFYLLDTSDSVRGTVDIGLGPTLLGLGVVGLLFCLPVAWKILRALHTPRERTTIPEMPAPDETSAFDPDAALARYLARKAAETEGAMPAPRGGPAPTRPSFGRKGV